MKYHVENGSFRVMYRNTPHRETVFSITSSLSLVGLDDPVSIPRRLHDLHESSGGCVVRVIVQELSECEAVLCTYRQTLAHRILIDGIVLSTSTDQWGEG